MTADVLISHKESKTLKALVVRFKAGLEISLLLFSKVCLLWFVVTIG